MDRDGALGILRTSLRKAKRWGELCEVDERSMQEIIAALSSPCACGGREPIAVAKVTLRKHPKQHTHFAILPIYYQPEGDGPFHAEAIVFADESREGEGHERE